MSTAVDGSQDRDAECTAWNEPPKDPTPSSDPFDFLRVNRPALVRVCLRWTRGHRADAADLLAEATLRVLESQGKGESAIHNPFAWWCRIIANLAHDLHRSRSDALRLTRDDLLTSVAIDSLQVVAARQDIGRVRGGLTTLPALQSEAVLLRAVGCDYPQIAESLRVSRENARKLVQLARARLRAWPASEHPPMGESVH